MFINVAIIDIVVISINTNSFQHNKVIVICYINIEFCVVHDTKNYLLANQLFKEQNIQFYIVYVYCIWELQSNYDAIKCNK